MALYRGGSEPSAIYRGNQQVSAIYRGSQKVYSSESPMSATVTRGFAAVNETQLMAHFTIKTTGPYSISYGRGDASQATVTVNGFTMASYSYYSGPDGGTTALILNAGDKVEFTAMRRFSDGPITVTYDCAPETRYSYSESQDSTTIFIRITAADTWETISSGTNPWWGLQTAGTARAEWTRMGGDRTYGIRFIVNGTQTAYQQVQGGGGTNVYQTLTIPEQAIPAGATWAVQVRTSDPYSTNNRRIRRASIILA